MPLRNNSLLLAKAHLSQEALTHIEKWLNHYPYFSKEIITLIEKNDWEELEDAFYKHIEIGTGGIRGTIGVGPNRINMRTIGEAAQGLCEFIKDFGKEAMEKGVVVAYEARKHSKDFALLSCEVFAANGIKSFLFDNLRSTPEVSFAVRHLKTSAGVEITASHNPRTDNGFKFYWSDGGQVVSPLDIKFMELVTNVGTIKRMPLAKAKRKKLITIIGKEVDEAYQSEIRTLSLVSSRSARIVFSPIHGAGSTNVLSVLKKEGFRVTVVPEQLKPDERFPTATGELINPEYKSVMALPIALATKKRADLALMSDPDADRIGVATKKILASPSMQFLTGNEVGALLAYFILSRVKEKRLLRPSNLVIETYVTTTLISDITKDFGIRVIDDLLVGFKFIGEIIEKLPHKNDFLFAAEESLGYLRGAFVRDKDAAIAALLVAEMASWLKDRKRTVIDYLDEIYIRYGYYKNRLCMREMKGKKGFMKKKEIMEALRHNPPRKLGNLTILQIIDRLPKEKAMPKSYNVGATGDQISFILSRDGRTRVTVRPSGTEPKLKYYIQHYQKVTSSLAKTKREVDQVAKELETAILEYTR